MGEIKRFSFEERQLLEKYLKEGKSFQYIAKLMNRSPSGLGTEVNKLGRFNYSAKTAQKMYEKRCNLRNERLHQTILQKKSSFPILIKQNENELSLKQRIENLEMQIELLHNSIKELSK